jgi:ribokinase
MESVQAAIEIASRSGGTVLLNPAPAAQVPDAVLARVDVLTPNEHEAKVLAGIEVRDVKTAERAAEALMARGVKAVVITMGSRGAYLASDSTREMVPAWNVAAVDTTAAGDVFSGTLAVALTEHQPLREAAHFASAAAALSVTKLGAQPSIPTRKEIDLFLSRYTLNLRETRNHRDILKKS